MNRQMTIYNAFTGISPIEKKRLVTFLCDYAGNTNCHDVQEALDYALKRKPSFGGFVITIMDNKNIEAALVVNRTGMEGYNPNNICVFVAVNPDADDQSALLQELMGKAINYAHGDIAMHIEPDHPALQIYQQMGFRAQYLELRLDKNHAAIA